MDDGTAPSTHPYWWRGLRWGVIAGLTGDVVCGMICYDLLLHDALVAGLTVFLFLFVVFGIVGALRPQVVQKK